MDKNLKPVFGNLISAIFIAVICIGFSSNSYGEMSVDKKVLDHFIRVFLPTPDDVVRKWTTKPTRITVTGSEAARRVLEKNKTYLEKLLNRKLIITNENVNCFIVFTEDIYKEAFLNGTKYFGFFLVSKSKIYDFFHDLALQEPGEKELISNVRFRGYDSRENLNFIISVQSLSDSYYADFDKYVFMAILNALIENAEKELDYPSAFGDRFHEGPLLEIDKQVISLLYRDEIKSGMTAKDVLELFN